MDDKINTKKEALIRVKDLESNLRWLKSHPLIMDNARFHVHDIGVNLRCIKKIISSLDD